MKTSTFCYTTLKRIVPTAIGGKWIPFTAAEVAARRAAQMVAVVVCVTVTTTTPAAAPPPCDCFPPPSHYPTPMLLIPAVTPLPRLVPYPTPVHTPEPASLALFGVGVVGLVLIRRKRNAIVGSVVNSVPDNSGVRHLPCNEEPR